MEIAQHIIYKFKIFIILNAYNLKFGKVQKSDICITFPRDVRKTALQQIQHYDTGNYY